LGENITGKAMEEMTQKETSFKIDQNNRSLLSNQTRESGSVREMARLASVGLAHAGDWLNVVPSPALGLHLRSQEFIAVTKYRLGANIYPRESQCPACGHHSDRLGDHAMCCSSNGERISRHNILRDAIYTVAQSAALGPSKEGRFLLPGTDRRPADILIPHWAGGKDAALDVTVINPLQIATVAEAAVRPGSALTVAFNRKVGSAGELCRRQGLAFVPLAAESLGGWHEVAVGEFRKLGAALGRHAGQEESEATSQLFQRLSILLMKGNANLFVNRVSEDI
jgi:hypothetical protein